MKLFNVMTYFLRQHAVRIVIGAVLLIAVYAGMSIYFPYERERRIAAEIQKRHGNADWGYYGPSWLPEKYGRRLRIFNRVLIVDGDSRILSPDVKLHLLSKLEVLFLDDVSDNNLARLKCPAEAFGLHIRSKQLTDSGLEHLRRLTQLTALGLECKSITDIGLARLNSLTNLEYFTLQCDGVCGTGFANLEKLTLLQGIDLTGTPVNDVIFEYLVKMKHLRRLFISHTQVTSEGCDILQKALPDCDIRFDQCG